MPRSIACRPESMKSAENAAKNVIPLRPGPNRRDKHELAFLPAALEIVETPPSPIGRAIGLTIVVLFCLALAWASLGKVDIIASAPGKIIPSGRTKVIQPFETGVVMASHMRDGQSVEAGEVLIELDPTMNEAERNHLRSDLTSAWAFVWSASCAGSCGATPEPLTLGLRLQPCRSSEESERGGFSPTEASCLSPRPFRLTAAIGLPALRKGV
jgi:hypothetical protein